MSRTSEISNSRSRHILPTLTLHPREEHPHMASLKASTSKPKSITQDVTMMNMMHQKTNAGIRRTLHVRLIYMLNLWHNGIDMPLGPGSPGLRALYLTSTHTLAPLAHLCYRRCLYNTLQLEPVPLTHTRVWRNELYPLLSYSQL